MNSVSNATQCTSSAESNLTVRSRKLVSTLLLKRALKSIPLQDKPNECGYVCVVAVLAQYGIRITADQVSTLVGSTSRGLTIRQLRDGLRVCGVEAQPVFLHPHAIDQLAPLTIALLKEGHFVLARRKGGRRVEVFDPSFGWSYMSVGEFSTRQSGHFIEIGNFHQETFRALAAKHELNQEASHAELFKNISLPVFSTALGWKCLGVAFLSGMLLTMLPALSGWVVDIATPGGQSSYLSFAGLVFLSVAVTGVASEVFSNFLMLRLSSKLTQGLALHIFDSLYAKPPEWFESRSPLSLPYKLTLIDALRSFYIELPLEVVRILILAITGSIALVFLSPVLLIPGVIAFILSGSIDLYFNRIAAHLSFSAIRARSNIQRFVVNIACNFPVLARLGAISSVRAVYQTYSATSASADVAIGSLQARQTAWQNGLRLVDQILFATLAAYFVQKHNYTIGFFVAIGAFKDNLIRALGQAFQLSQKYALLEPYRSEVYELLRDKHRSPPKDDAATEGRIVVNGVTFRYGKLEQAVLQDCSLDIVAGGITAIHGRSGTGKTTLLKVVCGLLEPESGTVLIDGHHPTTINAGIGYVAQGGNLLTASIRDNVSVFRTAFSDGEIYNALDAVEMGEFVRRLPMKLDTKIGDDISSISGGQRQRLLIARAILARPAVLILDEATANLDVELEERLLSKLRDWAVTIVISSHRPGVWDQADKVIALGAET